MINALHHFSTVERSQNVNVLLKIKLEKFVIKYFNLSINVQSSKRSQGQGQCTEVAAEETSYSSHTTARSMISLMRLQPIHFMSAKGCTVLQCGTADDKFDSVDCPASIHVSYNSPTNQTTYETRHHSNNNTQHTTQKKIKWLHQSAHSTRRHKK